MTLMIYDFLLAGRWPVALSELSHLQGNLYLNKIFLTKQTMHVLVLLKLIKNIHVHTAQNISIIFLTFLCMGKNMKEYFMRTE